MPIRFCLLILILFTLINADEATYLGVNLKQGVIFSNEETPHIHLRREILWLPEMKGWESDIYALLEFENTSDSIIVLPTTFPIAIEQALYYKGIYEDHPYNGRYTFGKTEEYNTLVKGSNEKGKIQQLSDEKAEIIKGLESFRYELFDSYGESFDRFITKDLSHIEPIQFAIFQDDKKIPTDSILIERGESQDVNLFLFHKLTFPAKSRTRLFIKYRSHINLEFYKSEYHPATMHYIIGTGGTWKGPIDSLYIVTPYEVKHNGYRDSTKDLFFTDENKNQVALITHWDPPLSQVITFSKEYICDEEEFDYSACVSDEPSFPALINIKDISASTSLIKPLLIPNEPCRFYENENFYNSDLPLCCAAGGNFGGFSETCSDIDTSIMHEWGIYFKNVYAPEWAFDYAHPDDPYFGKNTAWCWKDSIDAEVSFTLTKPATAVTVYTGYQKSRKLWEANGRPLRLTWHYKTKGVEKSWSTILEDIYGPQTFKGEFPPGEYTLKPRHIKKGSKYSDACLSGIEFTFQGPQDPWYIEGMKNLKTIEKKEK